MLTNVIQSVLGYRLETDLIVANDQTDNLTVAFDEEYVAGW